MRLQRALILPVIAATAALIGSCEPCAGVLGCHTWDRFNYTGQFIERKTGNHIGGVHLRFERDSGPLLVEIPETESNADGFFTLSLQTYGGGVVFGRLIVTPPAPFVAYTIPNFRFNTTTISGEGVSAGRLVVDPYIFLIGEVFNRNAGHGMAGTVVTMKRIGGTMISPDSVQFTTDGGGRFLFQPTVLSYETGAALLDVRFDVPGDPQVYRFQYALDAEYRERQPVPILLGYPRLFAYSIDISRRGTGQTLDGAGARFIRTGGVRLDRDTLSEHFGGGRFIMRGHPQSDGDVVGDLWIIPPAPFQTEVYRGMRLPTHYKDTTFHLGMWGYGPGFFVEAKLLNRATGAALPEGVAGQWFQRGGQEVFHPDLRDTWVRITDRLGRIPFGGGTTDIGDVRFDLTVNVPGFPPHDTVRGITFRSGLDSGRTQIGPFKVGPWLPWYGELRTAGTNAPIAGAQLSFTPAQSGDLAQPYQSTSDATGRFLLHAVPLRERDINGTLSIQFPSGSHRDTILPGIVLRPTRDDTLRLLRVILAQPRP